MIEAFFGGGGDIWSTVVWFVLFVVFLIYGPKMMVTQTILKLEKDVLEFEQLAKKSRKTVFEMISKSPTKKEKDAINSFMEFFAVTPVSTDPYGVMKKLDHIIKQEDERFNYFVSQLKPDFSTSQKRNLKSALGGAITTYQIAKVVRHMLELIKKYKMFQYGMILQMQIPMIKDLAESAEGATTAFSKQQAIGDGIGPLVAASMIKGKVKLMDDEEFVYSETKVGNKTIIFSKASGPGSTVAKPGKFMQKILSKKKVNRIITIDAALKMEGEKSGSTAEGVGIAMNPGGTDRFEIEDIVVKKNIPLDAIVIKMSEKEALTPMSKDIVNAIPNAIELVKDNINRIKGRETILIMGVGNTCGIGNDHKEAMNAEKAIQVLIKKTPIDKKKKRLSFK